MCPVVFDQNSLGGTVARRPLRYPKGFDVVTSLGVFFRVLMTWIRIG
jgi:hypothetical protein